MKREEKNVDEVLNANEAAELLKLHQKTVYKMAQQGKIPAKRVGSRNWRFLRSELLEYIRGGENGTA